MIVRELSSRKMIATEAKQALVGEKVGTKKSVGDKITT